MRRAGKGFTRKIILFLTLAAAVISCDRQNTLIDPQGNTYKTITIGSQEWMAENLLLDVGQGSYCYDDNPESCIEMGRIYTWEAARMASDRIRGWHLPTKQEWQELIVYCGGDSVGYSTITDDDIGFNPQWAGVRISSGIYKGRELNGVNYWSSTTADTNSIYAYSVAVLSKWKIISPHNYPKENACSVRLIRDR